MHYTRNWRSFSLSPAAGERAGERGPPVSPILGSWQYSLYADAHSPRLDPNLSSSLLLTSHS